MTSRTDKEMTALLGKFDLQLGPLDKWSDQALEQLNEWLIKTSATVDHERVKRNSESESDA